jgi:hypothetical protein
MIVDKRLHLGLLARFNLPIMLALARELAAAAAPRSRNRSSRRRAS